MTHSLEAVRLDPTFPAFPADFVWGTATASYQIEGAVNEDGRGPSIWDTFSHTPGKTAGGDTGDVACDHYHRYRDDVALMKELGIGAYRFSIAWPRIQPDGRGPVNSVGLDFYSHLIDELLDAGIRPVVTLYHWDLPQALEDEGGWRSRETALRFAEYASDVHAALRDRVSFWITLNEPFCSAFLGYAEGRHAPGAREGAGALAAAHHLLLGHGLAVRALRDQAGPGDQVGVTLNLSDVRPASDGEPDASAARRSACLQNQCFTDPILAGRYPDAEGETWPWLTEAFSRFRQDGDLDVISAPIDFLGLNTYFPYFAQACDYTEPHVGLRTAADIGVRQAERPDLRHTAMGWPVDASIMSGVLGWLRRSYPNLPPVYVTENGAAYPDAVVDGQVHDGDRIAYLDAHLRNLHQAMDDGADVRGYFCWSFMDNYEWAFGYAKRFGLVHVDYQTQARTPKDSFAWYREVATASKG